MYYLDKRLSAHYVLEIFYLPLMRCISHSTTGRITWARFVRIERIDNSEKGFLAYSVLEIFYIPLMRCISPFDNGSYHMDTIRTNRTNRQLGEGFLGLRHVRNILRGPNEMHFSIRQRVVSHGHDSYESTATAQLFYDSCLFRCIGQPLTWGEEVRIKTVSRI